ncbi:class I adenylate-forming enzyme family protein [Segeticoccus rhizosphaerae]|uniref:class I adenylate-forming enzyme family protein n=1 Tax=Segeticoccus rhizosphaerae TaxID=1104777 RepID=UPI0010BF8B5C|nr:AMP-binding protein [Ornithinicoccus soli]
MAGITPAEVARRREALERRVGAWTPRSLAAAFDEVARQFPDRPYVITAAHALSYAQVQRHSVDLAGGLMDLGVELGDRVALLVDNRPEYAAVKLAIARAGAVAVPLNYSYTGDEVSARLRQARAKVLVTVDATRATNFLAVLDRILPGWEKGAQSRQLPDLEHVVTVEPVRDGALDLDGLAMRSVGDDAVAARCALVDPDAVCDIVFTSGTTGHVLGAELTHDMVLRSAYGSAYHRAFDDGWRISFALPLYHVFGYIEGLLAAMYAGGAVVPQQVFNPKTVLESIEEHRVNEVLFVPTMTIAVVDLAASGDYDLSSLQSVFSAAAPAPTWLWERVIRDLRPTMIYTGYGQTEVSAATALTHPGDGIETVASVVGAPKLGGVAAEGVGLDGKLAQYRTVDPFTRQPLPAGEPGEFSVRGPQVTRRYFDDPERTAELIDEDGWLRTGDLGRVSAEGYLELTGRSSELFKVGGELVAPVEVEVVLTSYDGVSQAHVVGVPDDRYGEVTWAYVVPGEGATLDPGELVAHCRAHLAPFKVPRGVTFLTAEQLPTTTTGKVQKFRLRERSDRT